MKVTVIQLVIGTLSTVTKGLVQGLEDLEIKRRAETIHSIIEIVQNTEKSPDDLSRLLSLKRQWKTLKIVLQ